MRDMARASAPRQTSAAVRRIVEGTCFELVPLKNLEAQLEFIPAGSRVSVTCSPNKGIDETINLAARFQAGGLQATPHLAARMVRDKAHVKEIARRIADAGLDEAFVIAGDAEEPGEYKDTLAFLHDFLAEAHGVTRVGIAGYPDGHQFISENDLTVAMHLKAKILSQAGVEGWVSTQMCFDGPAIATWISAQRAAGLTLPVRLGIPGPIDRTKLLTMGIRVGVGQSLRYLKKNRAGLTGLISNTSYDPSALLNKMDAKLNDMNVSGLHLFTFNQIEGCVAWRNAVLAS